MFVGAGTSGRLGVLESAEMPPTFGTDPTWCRRSWPAGKASVFRAAEGVEDNYEEGARAVTRLQPAQEGRGRRRVGQRHDAVRPRRTGRRPARRAPASSSSPATPATELQTFVDLTIALGVGAEVIAGSTRLKAGTATKLVLNMLTTGAMVRIGKTYGNLMVDVQPTSEKLKDRARRIVIIVTGLDYEGADKLLRRAKWNVKAAIVMQKTGLPLTKAMTRLRKAHGLDARGARRGHRAAPAGTAEPGSRRAAGLDRDGHRAPPRERYR